MQEVFPKKSALSLDIEANNRASYLGISPDEALNQLTKEFKSYGAYKFSFDDATVPAIKQIRPKIILANTGAINIIIDECYLPSTEVLTSEGWKRFDECIGNELIAQFDENSKNITFVEPLRFISKDYSGDMYHFFSKKNFDFHITAGHEMLVYSSNTGKPKKLLPSEITTGYSINSIGYSDIDSSHKVTPELRMSLTIQADGTIRHNGTCAEISFSKQRKINEFEALLLELGITASSRIDSKGRKCWYLSKDSLKGITLSKNLHDILPPVNEVSLQFARDVLDELVKWDGSIQKEKTHLRRFTCKYKYNVDLVCAYAVLAGYKTKVYTQSKKGYSDSYYCHWDQKSSGLHQLTYINKPNNEQPAQRAKYHYEGKVYCFTVPSGNLVLRHNDIVFTGSNCGSNFAKLEDVLTTFLELYDLGFTRDKLTKNTETSLRFQELIGSTPSNLMMFGTPSKLLDGGKTETDFFNIMEAGLARRSFFNFSTRKENENTLTPEEQYDLLTQQNNEQELDVIAHNLWTLANINLVGNELEVPRDVGIELMAYRQWCEDRCKNMSEYAEIQRAEMKHRYFKALKLAGTYAFIDNSFEIKLEHLHQAIRFTEETGKSVEKLFYREKPYEKLAKYIAESKGTELTQVDLQNELPFYKGSQTVRNEMMINAIAWGYKNNIIIKKSFKDGIEFITGEALEPNDLTKCIVAYSQSYSSDYLNADGKESNHISFENLPKLLTLDGYHWINHYSVNGNRKQEDMVEGFNLLTLDIDSGVSLEDVKVLLKDYSYIIHTTKRHQSIDPETGQQHGDRFRVILPTNYTVKLSQDEYKEFMNNLADWLPFSGLDKQTFQMNRKWSSYSGAQVFTNEGQLIDITPFIPRTSRNEEYVKQIKSLGSLDNLERWFASKSVSEGRNNTLIKYGLMLLDGGVDLQEAKIRVLEFNGKLEDPLDETEVYQTIFISMEKH